MTSIPEHSRNNKNIFSQVDKQINLQIAFLFAPLAYCLHQIEESTGAFKVWRQKHFHSSSSLPDIYVFVALTAISLFLIILFSIRKNKSSAIFVILFFMTTQVQNILYHIGTSIYFADFSPGTLTALVLYVPVNFYILTKAFREGWLTKSIFLFLFVLSGIMYWTFELLGPAYIGIFLGAGFVYSLASRILGWKASPNSHE